MGYEIEQNELNVKIPKSKRTELLAVFKQLREKRDQLGSVSRGGGTKVYKWADEFEYSENLTEMFEAFRYVLREEGEFYVIDEFEGDKIGDDYTLWKYLKPLVTEDSTCTFYGEDHAELDFLEGT